MLGKLRARFGVYAVLGNHDHWTDAALITDLFRAEGITVLINQGMHFEHRRCVFLASRCRRHDGGPGRYFAGAGGRAPGRNEAAAGAQPDYSAPGRPSRSGFGLVVTRMAARSLCDQSEAHQAGHVADF